MKRGPLFPPLPRVGVEYSAYKATRQQAIDAAVAAIPKPALGPSHTTPRLPGVRIARLGGLAVTLSIENPKFAELVRTANAPDDRER